MPRVEEEEVDEQADAQDGVFPTHYLSPDIGHVFQEIPDKLKPELTSSLVSTEAGHSVSCTRSSASSSSTTVPRGILR